MTKETASQLLGLMDGLCETEQGRLAVAVLRYIATGEKEEPRGTERAFFKKACEMVDVHLHNIYINKSKDLLSQETCNNVRNTDDNIKNNSLPSLFDKFWDAYPHHYRVNKKRCVSIWNNIKPSAELVDTMIESVEAWKKSRQWQQGYVPNPDTWLRNEKWNDANPEPWKDPKQRHHYANERDPISEEEFNALVVDLDKLEV